MIYVQGNAPSAPYRAEVSNTSSLTAGTGSDTLMDTMTLTPPAGTYLAIFSCDISSSTAGAAIQLSIYVGGTQKADSQRKVIPMAGGLLSGTGRVGVTTNGFITVTGSQAIEIRWSASNSGCTAAACTLDILKVG